MQDVEPVDRQRTGCDTQQARHLRHPQAVVQCIAQPVRPSVSPMHRQDNRKGRPSSAIMRRDV